MPAQPVLLALGGALAIAFTGVLVRLADVEPATAAFWRCAYALPVLGMLAWVESGRNGRLGRRPVLLGALAGVFFAADLELWHHSIAAVGAGLSTVVAISRWSSSTRGRCRLRSAVPLSASTG